MSGRKLLASAIAFVLLVAGFAIPQPADAAPLGTVTVLPSATVAGVSDVTTGANGNVWFANNGSARPTVGRITPLGAITLFDVPSRPSHVTAGPDGNIWYTRDGGIGRVTPAGQVTDFVDAAMTGSGGITAGPDGNLWVTARAFGPASIKRITTAGAITTFPLAPTSGVVRGITAGPDGNVWFVAGGSVNRITASGTVTTFTDPAMVLLWDIVAGPDGALWFTNNRNNSIGRITTSGTISFFTDPNVVNPKAITAGPDGNLWFTTEFPTVIGRITPAGAVTVFTDPTLDSFGDGVTGGADGALWFGQGSGIGRVTVSGTFTAFQRDDGVDEPYEITAGPDGNLWFTNKRNDSIGRVTPAGVFSNFTDPTIDGPTGITSGPDGNLWFTNEDGHSVGRITPAGVVSRFFVPSTPGQFGSFLPYPTDITVGADGNLWIAKLGTALEPGYWGGFGVVRMTPSGEVTGSFGAGSRVGSITATPGGQIWYTATGHQEFMVEEPIPPYVGCITTGGQDCEGVLGDDADFRPNGIVAGPDGNVWFTEGGTTPSIGRIRPSLEVTYFSGPNISGGSDITVGPDRSLWYSGAGVVGRITTSGVATSYTVPNGGYSFGITSGPDGNVWFTGTERSSVGRVSAFGTSMAYPASGTAASWGTYLLAGTFGDTAVTEVEFRATGGTLNDVVVNTAGRTFFGWFGGWSTANVPEGNYRVSAVARDGAGNTARSAPITVIVDHTPPIAQMLVPDPGATLRGSAVLDAGATDSNGVASVEFRLNGNGQTNRLVGTGTLTYYGWIATWNTTTVDDGTYTLRARATDRAGIVGTSAPITIRVDN